MRPLIVLLLVLALPALASSDPPGFWDSPRHGANWFNLEPRTDWLRAAREAGLGVVRMTPAKWKGQGRDFLLGSADDFRGIPPADLALLIHTLDDAAREGVPVVVVPLSLPGARWRQHHGELDRRLWQDDRYLEQAAAFWRELAGALRGHPAVVGYDLLNEPVPERAGAADRLNRFNRRLLAAIREVDPDTPVIVESGLWASPSRFPALEALPDPRVLYSFHLYDPEEYTDWRNNLAGARPYRPGEIEAFLEPVVEWQRRTGVPSSRIFAAEFGCHRRLPGAEVYLAEAAAALTRHGWHWAFYSFREDEWEGMNYELGAEPISQAERAYLEGGGAPRGREGNPLWGALAPYLRVPGSSLIDPARP